jgi:hypothetical protein
MHALVGLAFCFLLGFMLKEQGISALLWVPLGFMIGLYVAAQVVLPLLLGLPRAASLVRKRRMRAGVFGGILLRVFFWLVGCFAFMFGLGFVWPSFATFLSENLALNLSLNLGMLAILLSPLSKKSRDDFRDDFDRAYGEFYIPNATEERVA